MTLLKFLHAIDLKILILLPWKANNKKKTFRNIIRELLETR